MCWSSRKEDQTTDLSEYEKKAVSDEKDSKDAVEHRLRIACACDEIGGSVGSKGTG